MYDTNLSILITHSYPQEESRKKPPSNKDITDTLKLIRDFQLPIPKILQSHDYNKLSAYFPTYSSLEIYRRTYITNQLRLMEQENEI